MKTFKLLLFFCLGLLWASCEDEPELYDYEKYKYVSFIDTEISISETYSVDAVAEGKEEGFPLYLRYDGSVLEEDFTVELDIVENLAQEGVHYTVATKTVLFKAGSIKSEPLYITILDNLVNSDEDGILEFSIKSVSNPTINIGVGMTAQANKELTFNIQDNECDQELDIFNSESLSLNGKTIKGIFDGTNSILRLEGDLVDYGPLANTSLEMKMNPVEQGAKIGTISFDDYYAGTDTDGWEYTYVHGGEGTYDICSGQIKDVNVWIYYLSGGSWVYWYTATINIDLE